MKRSIFILFLGLITFQTFGQLSFSLQNKFWRLKYARIGGKEYSLTGSDNAPTLQFSGGSIRGNGGCNAYHTKFYIDGNTAVINSISSTRMACNDLLLDEKVYFDALSQTQNIAYYDGEADLTMTNTSGDKLVYFAQFARSSESFVPPPRKSYRTAETSQYQQDEFPRRSKKSRAAVGTKLSKKEAARQKLLEKKMNSKRGKLTKAERRELMALQSKKKKGSKNSVEEKPNKRKGKRNNDAPTKGKKGKKQKENIKKTDKNKSKTQSKTKKKNEKSKVADKSKKKKKAK